ncbi:hypothetical protein MSG28_015304, partial [Choristoneura fumiferana]
CAVVLYNVRKNRQSHVLNASRKSVTCVTFSPDGRYLATGECGHAPAVRVWDLQAFSTSSKYLVSVGSQHDMIVNVWDWRSNLKLASNKKDNEFCDVVCGRGEAADSTYAITRSGLLCEFNSRRLLDKWVELRGLVRCFAPDSLRYVTTLPRTHYLGVDVAQGLNINHMFTQPPNARYPDAVALTYDDRNHKLTCVYNDHSLYVWDVRDIKRSHSALYHSACIWGVDMAPGGALPAGTFATCSSDDST